MERQHAFFLLEKHLRWRRAAECCRGVERSWNSQLAFMAGPELGKDVGMQ